jgi:hypothetical protein
MKTLADYLTEAGDEPFRCQDDTLVRQFMVETGNAGVLKDEGKKEWSQYIVVGSENHPTHWLLFAFHTGYPRESDNGYNLLALSKKTYSKQRASAVLNRVLNLSGNSTEGLKHLGEFDPKKQPGAN